MGPCRKQACIMTLIWWKVKVIIWWKTDVWLQ
jgi:hypothetical protein